jgi:hypothetical protein
LVSLLLGPGLTIEIITVVTMTIIVHWDVTPCALIDIYRRFGGMCFLQLPSQRVTIFICKITSRHGLNYKNTVGTKFRGAENMLTCFSLKFSYMMFTVQFIPHTNTLHLYYKD